MFLGRELDDQRGIAHTNLATVAGGGPDSVAGLTGVRIMRNPEGTKVTGCHISWHDRARKGVGRIARKDQTCGGSRGFDALKRKDTPEIATLPADILKKDLSVASPGCPS